MPTVRHGARVAPRPGDAPEFVDICPRQEKEKRQGSTTISTTPTNIHDEERLTIADRGGSFAHEGRAV